MIIATGEVYTKLRTNRPSSLWKLSRGPEKYVRLTKQGVLLGNTEFRSTRYLQIEASTQASSVHIQGHE